MSRSSLPPSLTSRRSVVRALAAVALYPGWLREVVAHNMAGRVKPPIPVPDVDVVLHNGRKTNLRELMTGRATAVQLMFTGCSATCPIQGALFAEVQQQLPSQKLPLQLISVSIDTLGDSPGSMQTWLSKYKAGSSWLGAIPTTKHNDVWLDFLNGRTKGLDRHTGQVFFFNQHAELNLRTVDFPKPEEVARLLVQLARETSIS